MSSLKLCTGRWKCKRGYIGSPVHTVFSSHTMIMSALHASVLLLYGSGCPHASTDNPDSISGRLSVSNVCLSEKECKHSCQISSRISQQAFTTVTQHVSEDRHILLTFSDSEVSNFARYISREKYFLGDTYFHEK